MDKVWLDPKFAGASTSTKEKQEELFTTTHYPVLFTYRDVIIGAGYVAHVEASGRFLIEDKGTDEDVWIYGVNPGGATCGKGRRSKRGG